jgi:thymidylate synthase
MNNLDKQYTDLLQDILDNGTKKETRNGGTISVFGRQIRHKMSDGFPLLTTKKMAWRSICTELIWFLKGDTSIEYLLKNDCNIWTGDAYQDYLKECKRLEKNNEHLHPDGRPYTKEEFVEKIKTDKSFTKRFGNLGKIYGYQWRNWNGEIDQISELIRQLKDNPDSRRLLVSAWNASDLPHQVLPPCHYGFQVYTRELSDDERAKLYEQKTNVDTSFFPVLRETLDFHNIPTRAISLMWNQRSVDTFLGLPFNIASYGLLLMMIADEVNMVPDELIGNLGDTHIYLNHVEQAKEQIGRERTHEEMVEIYHQIENKKDRDGYWTWETRFEDNNISRRTREPYPLPTVHVRDGIFCSSINDVILENYQSHPSIKAPLSN